MRESVNREIGKWGHRFIVIMLAVWLVTALPVWAQEDGLTISVSKQFGYNMGSQIQGTFKIRVRGPEDLSVVTFLLDGELLDETTTAPFEFTFKTDDYSPGWHGITAIGTTTGGQTLTGRTVNFQFVTAEAAGEGTMKLLVPVIVFAVATLLISAVFPMLTGRKQSSAYDPSAYTPGEPRSYGMFGGVVCPKCGQPFGMHWWGLNISLVGKFDRCPHCGKWSLVRRASREALIDAEAEEHTAHTATTPRPASNVEEKLREQLDDSRFTDRI